MDRADQSGDDIGGDPSQHMFLNVSDLKDRMNWQRAEESKKEPWSPTASAIPLRPLSPTSPHDPYLTSYKPRSSHHGLSSSELTGPKVLPDHQWGSHKSLGRRILADNGQAQARSIAAHHFIKALSKLEALAGFSGATGKVSSKHDSGAEKDAALIENPSSLTGVPTGTKVPSQPVLDVHWGRGHPRMNANAMVLHLRFQRLHRRSFSVPSWTEVVLLQRSRTIRHLLHHCQARPSKIWRQSTADCIWDELNARDCTAKHWKPVF
jgi:hypothetical protein